MKVCEDFTIMEKAPTRAFSWLRVPTSAFTFTFSFVSVYQFHNLPTDHLQLYTSHSSRAPATHSSAHSASATQLADILRRDFLSLQVLYVADEIWNPNIATTTIL